ncbi:ComEC/Rec2 family competence protein [uncultured Lutibacter sp.]|uniref:ComEC/Rec2 family competence protein n=1 Tax=uncultured Lutibacter sp. TaxID=437739 RepID=UPI002618E0D8|nr:ComEC/Rec2 family competence protein [uncultured Lutibacter sp.]
MKFVPFQLTIFLVLGILVGKYFIIQPQLITLLNFFAILILAIVYYFENKRYFPSIKFSIAAFLAIFFIGINAIVLSTESHKNNHYSVYTKSSKNQKSKKVITIKKVLKPTMFYDKYEAEILQVNNQITLGKILVNLERDSSNVILNVGDTFIVNSGLKEIKKPLNPYEFNYKNYLKNQQINHQIIISERELFSIAKTNITLKNIVAKIRIKIIKSLKKYGFKNDELAVVNALILGQRQDISESLLESYTGAGAIHILAVSGLHIGIILMLLTFIFKPISYFKHGKTLTAVIIILLLWMYAIIAGLSPSVVRAVAMFTAITIGMYLNRPSNVYNSLIISMFFLLLFHPFYLFEVGFQLSYLAVFFIVWIQPKLFNIWISKVWILRKIWQLFTVSIAAQIGVLPLSLYYFHQFPSLFFISNLVIIPFLGVILIVGVIIIVCAILNILPSIVGDFYILIIQKMNFFVSWIAHQETFLFKNIPFSFSAMLASYLVIILFVKWQEKKSVIRFKFVLFSVIVFQIVVLLEKQQLETTNEFIVFNKIKSGIIVQRYGDDIILFSKDSISKENYPVKPYLIEAGMHKLKVQAPRNFYQFLNTTVLAVDSLGIYNIETIKPTAILLQYSPKINLERLLNTLHPKLIIADGSNYKNLVKNWEETCLKNKTPFYNTMQKGAFILRG